MNESAGKQWTTRFGKGAPWLKTAPFQAAWSSSRTEYTHNQAKFMRLKARRGTKKAIVAEIFRVANLVLLRKVPYHELDLHLVDRLEQTNATQRHVRRLQSLGNNVLTYTRLIA